MNLEGLKIFLKGLIGHLNENFSSDAMVMYKNTVFTDIIYPTNEEMEANSVFRKLYEENGIFYQGDHDKHGFTIEGRIVTIIPGVLIRVCRQKKGFLYGPSITIHNNGMKEEGKHTESLIRPVDG